MTSPALSPLRRPFTLPLAALLLGLLALPSATLPAEELRTWTSIDGRRIEARFIEFDPVSGKVSLQLGNDREIRYPLTHLSDDPGKRLRLPADYKYVDGEPGMVVEASTYFGERIDPAPGQALRESFADWLTAPSNPRFTRNIANRLWKHVFGLAPVEPANHLPGHLGDSGSDPELLDHLAELLVEHDYRLKEFLKALYATAPFQGVDLR